MEKLIWTVSVVLLMLACQPADPAAHTHSGADSHQQGETISESHTLWTENVELFVEFKPLVTGELSNFAAHFTRLSDYKPLKEGKVTVSLIVGEKGIRQTVERPTSPGIFQPALTPGVSGIGQLIFELKANGLDEKILMDGIQVHQDMEQATAGLSNENITVGAIDFLKEQAWKIDFQVQPVRHEAIAEIIRTTGEILPMHGDQRIVAAPSSGLIAFARSRMVPGVSVRKGQWLFSLISTGDPENNLQARLADAKAKVKKMEAEFERKQKLLQENAIAKKDFETAEMEFSMAKTELDNLNAYLAEGGRKVFSPMAGYIRDVDAEPGDFVETGNHVLSISQNRKLQLVADVPQLHFQKLNQIKHAEFKTIYNPEMQSIEQYNGRLISFGQSISRDDPFIPIYFELDNEGDLLPGSYVEMFLHTGVAKEGIGIPRESLLEEFGQYFVMVQLSGESFEKRMVKIGLDNGYLVEVLEGLKLGDMLVTKGAYQLKTASMASSLPAHGHTH